MKRICRFFVLFLMTVPLFPGGGFCFEDCFNYRYTRQDQMKTCGWDSLKAFESNKDNFMLEKRWPTVNLELTREEETARFGATGLEETKKEYLSFHYDGRGMRMFVYFRIAHAAGERKLIGYRAEWNPPMPAEYLNPTYPEEKKAEMDWKMVIHWVYPADIRGTGILIHSHNNKDRDDDTWVWFPSLRKTRRLTPANGDDAVGGSDATFAECFQLRITDEKHQIIGETVYRAFTPMDYYDHLSILDKYGPGTKEYMEFIRKIDLPRDCWVIRGKSVKGGYGDWYGTRIFFVDKEWGCLYGWEIYDFKGEMMKTALWPNRRASDYNGKPVMQWMDAEILNFEDRGFTYAIAPQTINGAPVPEPWFTLRELKRSVPTVIIPYMVVLPPRELAPLAELYPPEIIEARKKFFPERLTTFPNPMSAIGMEKF